MIYPDQDQSIREQNCVTTNASPSHGALQYLTNFAGAYKPNGCEAVQPLWDFGKISAGSAQPRPA